MALVASTTSMVWPLVSVLAWRFMRLGRATTAAAMAAASIRGEATTPDPARFMLRAMKAAMARLHWSGEMREEIRLTNCGARIDFTLEVTGESRRRPYLRTA